MSTTRRSGLRLSAIALRRSDDVPSTAPGFRSASFAATGDRNASRTSSRSRQAAMTRPSGSRVGMSLAEWTAISTAPESSASSISLVNSPLPPASISDRSVMRSPVVRIGTMAIASAGSPATADSLRRVSSACARASGLPRVPMRVAVVCKGRVRMLRRSPQRNQLPGRIGHIGNPLAREAAREGSGHSMAMPVGPVNLLRVRTRTGR